ncbi:hypothetical protein GLE_4520 [Lysobacter enzymogenes]|uniref:Uncharacterized protein n=1 Tax=Lysobacter enzymogenes TaxID=69 RepID=A0A0S2DMT9_LYSEN|nr:hypothetical protein GLE_4520 [Lysobacter enzymogenes]
MRRGRAESGSGPPRRPACDARHDMQRPGHAHWRDGRGPASLVPLFHHSEL